MRAIILIISLIISYKIAISDNLVIKNDTSIIHKINPSKT